MKKRIYNIDPEFIIKTVCDYFDLTEDEMNSKRKRQFMYPKKICIKLISLLCKDRRGEKITLQAIGSYFYGLNKRQSLDHTTIIHAVKTTDNLIETLRDFRLDYLLLLEKCREYVAVGDRDILVKNEKFYLEKFLDAKEKVKQFDREHQEIYILQELTA